MLAIPSDPVTIAGRLEFLGSGVFRKVYDLGTSVLKLDHTLLQTGQPAYLAGCNDEADTWFALESTPWSDKLAQVLVAGPGWLVQAKVSPIYSQHHDEWRSLSRELEAFGILDARPHNYGVLPDGRVVVCDYAVIRGRAGELVSSHRTERKLSNA